MKQTVAHLLKRTFATILAFTVVSGSMLASMPTSYAADLPSATVTYDFHKLGVEGQETQAGWSIDSQTDTSILYKAPYGLQVDNYSADRIISFNFDVPAGSPYELQLSSALAAGGCIANVLIDDNVVGEYNFYYDSYVADTGLKSLKTIMLTGGTHKLSLVAASQPDGSWGYCMYPGQFVLVPKATVPTLDQLTLVPGKNPLTVGDTTVLAVSGKYSDGNIHKILNPSLQLTASGDDKVITIDSDSKEITAVGEGIATIQASVVEDGKTVEGSVQLTVMKETLTEIDLISDKMGLSSGDTAQLSVTGKLNTKADADLSNAAMEFATSNSNVATVDKSTKILTAVGNGTATITAKVTLDGVTLEKSILISVYNGTLQSVSASAVDTTLDFAQYSQINVKGTFSGDTIPVALNKDSLTFTSSNEDTIKANADGKVWAVGTGSASVTVKSNISGIEKTATVDFTVNQVTTILYDFHKLGVGTQETQPSWDIVTAETNPTLSAQPYGLHVENDSNGNEISFSFVVPLESPYQLQFSSAQASGGGVSSMMIDGKEIKQWDFYSAVYVADTGLKPLKTMILTKGTHTFTMKSVSQTNGSWGYRMYPGSFVLVKKDSIPVLKDISLSASIAELSKGQTSQLQVTGTLNDGTTDSLGDATIGYTSSNEAIATVDATGAVKATGVGTATLTATVTLDAVVISKTIQIVVNNAVLKSVTMTTDKTELVVGQTAQITLQGILTNSKSINLSDASVSYTSSDEAVATVDSNGIVTSVGEGSAIINASVTLGDITLANTVTIHVEKRILKQVELTAIDSATEVALGETKQLKVLATMNDGTAVDLTKNGVTVAYLSANTDIATVGQSTGLVTASTSNEGTANIQVNVTLDGITKSSTIAIKVFSWDTVKNEKQKSSLYTAAKVATARENVVKYSWAKAEKDNAVATADQFVALGNDYLWNLVTPQSLPRSYTVNDAKGSPTSGTDIYTKTGSNYPWIIDPVNHPFKIQDPISKEYFPTNDFASYYKSGLNGNGIFDPKLADKQYLINTSGNGKGDSWGVDDGYGFVNTDGTKYTFIAYYNHWLWYNGGATNYGFIQRALDSLRDAYLYTGEAKYAQSGTILLDRIADVYPSMDSSVYKWADGFQNSHGGTGLGKVVGSIWETILVPSFIRAYDAFYPGMDDPSIISFLSEKAAKYDISNPKSTSAAIKKNIEDGIIKQVVPGVKNCQLEGNTGMQQSCVALAAVVIDTLPETKDWLDFDFKESELTTNPRTVSGGDLWPILVNEVDRDGQGAEAAPGYNNLWLDQLKQVADVIDGYSLEGLDFSVDLYKNPKFMKMFKAFYPLILSGRYTAQIGDTGAVADPSIIANVDDCIQGFAKTGDPILAQLTYSLNHNSTNGIHADIFTKDPEKVAVDIKNVITAQGEFKLNSSNMTGFGFAALRDGINYIKTSGITYQFANMNIIEQTAQLKYFSNSGTEQFDALSDGNHITISFDVAKSNDYELDLRTFKSSSYGIYDIYIDDKLIHTYDF